VPATDARWLTVHRRTPALLPVRLARRFGETLRPAWEHPQGASHERSGGARQQARGRRATRG
jgi:hypothetical protein